MSLYSPTSKNGFVKLSDEEIAGLPKAMRDVAKYVRAEFKTQLDWT